MIWIHEPSWASIHCCFYSAGDRMVVIFPVSLLHYLRGTHFSPQPINPIFCHLFSTFRRSWAHAVKEPKEIFSTGNIESCKIKYVEILTVFWLLGQSPNCKIAILFLWDPGILKTFRYNIYCRSLIGTESFLLAKKAKNK